MDADTLVKVLRKYNVSFDAAVVKAALSDPNSLEASELAHWAAIHLSPDTLLTPDELNQYAALEESGLAEKLAQAPGLAETRVLSEQEIKDAIAALNRSTESITRYNDILKQQRAALDRIVSAAKEGVDAQATLAKDQTEKWKSQRQELILEIQQLSQSLSTRIGELDQQASEAGTHIQELVDTQFQADDKLLASLQKLGLELEIPDTKEHGDVVALRETCARLIKFTVETVKTKLDRIYLETLEELEANNTPITTQVTKNEVNSLQGELESLYSEILPVAQMSVEQQFLEPALKDLAARNRQSLANASQATDYIHDCLDYLIDRANDLKARLEAYRSYQHATSAVLDMARTELSAEINPATPKSSRATQQSGSPVRQQPKAKPRYSVGTPEAPLDETMRTLAISLPQEGDALDEKTGINELASILANRRQKAEDVAQNVQETFEDAAMRHLADGKLAIQLVRDSVLAESPYGEVQLVDPEIEGSIGVLTQALAAVEKRLKTVNAALPTLRGKNAKREELVSRWGS